MDSYHEQSIMRSLTFSLLLVWKYAKLDSTRHLLPHVIQIMPRNPKYDQFQPKGHHYEENPQSMSKMPENHKFYPFH